MAHVSKFYWTNWTWEDGCQVCGTIAERWSAEGTSHDNLKGDKGTHYKQPRICFYGHITWVYGSPSLPWLMKPCPVRNNITWILNCFFNTEGICSYWSDCKCQVLMGCLFMTKGGHAEECGAWTTGSSITIMCLLTPHWWLTAWGGGGMYLISPTNQSLLPTTSSFSQTWKLRWKGEDLTP